MAERVTKLVKQVKRGLINAFEAIGVALGDSWPDAELTELEVALEIPESERWAHRRQAKTMEDTQKFVTAQKVSAEGWVNIGMDYANQVVLVDRTNPDRVVFERTITIPEELIPG